MGALTAKLFIPQPAQQIAFIACRIAPKVAFSHALGQGRKGAAGRAERILNRRHVPVTKLIR
jgi:hypothetical protein